MKKYNFNAGPSMLPREVIENTAKQILDFNGSGLSLMEISHRAKDFQPVVDEAVSLFKELLDIPEGYSVIFLGGGASLQFMQIPANFLIKKAAYINSGTWAKKAMKEAKHFGEVVEIASSSDANFTFYPQVFDMIWRKIPLIQMIIETTRSSEYDLRTNLFHHAMLIHRSTTAIASHRTQTAAHILQHVSRLQSELSTWSYHHRLCFVISCIYKLGKRQKIRDRKSVV